MTTDATRSDEHKHEWLRPILVPALIALAVLVAGGVFVDRQNSFLAEERLRARVADQVSLIRAKLEGNITGNMQLVRGLVAAISTEPDMQQPRFAALLSNLLEERSQLRSVAAAPDLVVTMTYPLDGNEKAIGLDYRTNEAQREAALRARDTRKLVLAGPSIWSRAGADLSGVFPSIPRTRLDRGFGA